MKISVVILSLLFAWPAWAQKPIAVASFSIVGDWLRQIAPASLEVVDLVKPGLDAHVYSPSIKDMAVLKKARFLVRVGWGFEPWLDRAMKSAGAKGKTVSLGQAANLRGSDPHFWQDPQRAKAAVQALSDALSEEFPDDRSEIGKKTQAYLIQLDELQTKIEGLTKSLRGKTIMTSHDAFGYFAAAFGVKFLAPQGWSTETEPSAQSVARLIRQVREQKVKALFIENLTNPSLMKKVASETGAKIGGTLYADSLSAPSGPAPDYIRLMKYNAETIVSALKE